MATLLKKRRDTNLSEAERWASLAGAAGLIAYGLTRRDKAGAGMAALGGYLAYRGASGHCDLYQTLGVNTAHRGYEKGTGSKAGVPYELGIRVDEEIQIGRPPQDLYRFWRNLSNLPRFMDHIEEVREVDNGVSHWVVKGPAGMKLEWDAEIVNEIEPRLIGWRSLPGSQVDHGGSVHFDQEGEGTRVRVSLQYNPPAGSVGAWAARLAGEDPKRSIQQDLQRFKELMETGAVKTRLGKQSEKWLKKPGRAWEDNVQTSSEESFPASDAPSWTPETL